jgi:hypothetical protein
MGIGRKHKRGTCNNRSPRVGAAGIGPCYGTSRTSSRTARETESVVSEMQSNDNPMVSFVLNVNDDYKTPRFYFLGHANFPCPLFLAQETPVQVTENKEGENYQKNIMVAQCATATEETVANVATTVAANETVANVATTVATVAANEANENTNVGTPPVEINIDAFRVAPDGFIRSNAGTRMAQSRAVNQILEAILGVGCADQQSLALHKALIHPSLHHVAATAGFDTDKVCWKYQRANVTKVLEMTKKGGRSDNVKSAFIQSLMVALTSAPVAIKNNQPSLRKQAQSLGLGVSRGWRYLSEGHRKREKIETGEEEYPRTKKAKRSSRYTAEYRESIREWVRNHQFVRVSPIKSDMLQINGLEEPKLLREIPIREMHNDLVRSVEDGGLECALDTDGKPTISDSQFRKLLKEVLPQLRKASLRHKQMCGCETCIGMRYLQEALNRFRAKYITSREKEIVILRNTVAQETRTRSRGSRDELQRVESELNQYRDFVMPDGLPMHGKPKDALVAVMCAPVLDGHRRWECVLSRCRDCPKYPTPSPETISDDNDAFAQIPFRHYQTFTKCTVHRVLDATAKECEQCDEQQQLNERFKKGKIRRRKELTKSEVTIAAFMDKYYLPMLEKYRYHQSHVSMLSKYGIGARRHAAFKNKPNALFMKRDFAEAIQAEMDNEVQGDHFGKIRKMMLEGCSVEFFSLELDKHTKEFHSHLSDDCKQNAATSFENMKNVLHDLRERGVLRENVTVVYDNTDGCCSQYRCATSVFLLTLLSSMFKVCIDRLVHAPGHGKDEVDGLNATTKRFLCEKMAMTQKEDGTDNSKRMADWAMEGGTEKCLSAEAVRLLENPDRKDGVTDAGKNKKRYDNRAVTERHYHVLKGSDVRFDNLKMQTIKFNNVRKGKHNGLGSQYNIRTDPDLGVGFAAIRRIACACDVCVNQLSEPWTPTKAPKEQPRYKQNKECEMWSVFEGHNDWEIVEIRPGENTAEEEMEEVYATVLESIADVIASEIFENKIGAVSTVDNDYYLVKWTCLPYRMDGDQLLTEYDPPIHVKDGEQVCEGVYLEGLNRAKGWFYQTTIRTVVRLQQVLAADINMCPIKMPNNLLPRGGYPQREPPFDKLGKTPLRLAQLQQAERSLKIKDEDHEEILEEVRRRQLLDYEEEEEETDDDQSDHGVSDDSGDESDSDTSVEDE